MPESWGTSFGTSRLALNANTDAIPTRTAAVKISMDTPAVSAMPRVAAPPAAAPMVASALVMGKRRRASRVSNSFDDHDHVCTIIKGLMPEHQA